MKNNATISLMGLAYLCSCATMLFGCATMGHDAGASQTMYITVSCKRDSELSKDIVRRLELIQANAIYIEDGMMEYDIHCICKSDLTPLYKIVDLKDELSIVPGVFEVRLDDGRTTSIPSAADRVLPLHGY
jgi:hypothetical protein